MISLEIVLLLLNGFAAGKLTALELFWPFIRPGGGVLIYYLWYFLAAVVVFLIAQSGRRHRDRTIFWVAVTAVSAVVLIAASRQMAYRAVETQPRTDNDGVVQSRAAARFLLAGENPYQVTYETTDFGYFPSPAGRQNKNLAAEHYAYPPLQFLLLVPTVWLNDQFGSQFDEQILYLVLFLFYGTIVMTIASEWRWRTRLLLLTIGNPWLWSLALAGFNDILSVLLLVAAGAAIWRRWPVAASVLYGLAMVSKQTAWLTIPLWVGLIWWMFADRTRAQRFRWFGVSLATAGVIALPFFFWSPGAMYDDVIRYVSGSIPMTYPLSGHTLLQYLRPLGLVDSPWTQLPAWPFQLVAWLPMVFLGWRSIRRQPTASVFLGWSGAMILAVVVVSRFAPDNYFLAVLELFIAAYAFSLAKSEPAKG